MTKEKLHVFDGNLKRLNKYIYSGDYDKLSEGEYVSISRLFIEYDGKYLFEKRSTIKDGKYGSVGGRTSYMEEPIDTIIRETYEEIGYKLNKDDIKLLGLIKKNKTIVSVYYSNINIDINSLKLQTEEVDYVTYLTKEEVFDEIKSGNMGNVTADAFIKYI